MKRISLLIIFALSAATLSHAQGNWAFKGSVTRMRMADCTMQHGFMATMSGVPVQMGATCPEYTVVSDKVVYVVVGRRGDEFIPLAENMEFLIHKNELVIFSDDEKTKSRFVIQQMTLRADWDREEARKALAEKIIMEHSANYELRNPTPGSMSANQR